MPYALIPDGFTLKKVTPAQENAVKDHRRHEDFKTFLDNETTPLLIGATAIAALTPALLALFIKLLEDQGITIDDVQREGMKAGLISLGPIGWAIVAGEKAVGKDFATDSKDRAKFVKDFKKTLMGLLVGPKTK